MKTIFIAVIFLSFCSGMLYAQEGDSISVSQKNREFAADSSARYLYDLAKKRPYLVLAFLPENYNTIAIGQQITDGDFIPVQGATRLSDSYLNTEGQTFLKDVSLWGSFSYHKTSEDSTRWAQQSRNNPSVPYYYGSPAYISYNRSVYQFNGVAERNMIKDNLPLAVGIDYRIGDHYATNDPRGAVSDFQLNLLASVGYKLNDMWRTGTALRYGYGQERTKVDYKNEKYFQSNVYPDYTNYAINGYGEPIPKNNERRFDNDMERIGVEAYLFMDTRTLGQFLIAASFTREHQFFNYKSTDSELIRSHNDYDLNTFDTDLIWTKSSTNKEFMLALNYLNADGSDYNYTVNSNNYLYNNNSLSLKTILTVKAQNKYNYHLELIKQGEERQDGLSGNLINYNNLRIKGGAGFVKENGAHSWGINLSGFYSMPLNDQFIVPPGNEKIFTKGVIYHDYLFHTSSYAGTVLTADYNFPGYKNIQTGLRLGLGYISNLDMKTLDRNPSSLPGNNRMSANLSLNLYF